MNIHEKYIKRCIELAKNGLGTTAPNPMVGCVIVFDGCIIGEGCTSAYGGNHAEVNAIGNVRDKSLLPKSTLYVSLEPCNHFGKTPPCTDLIISTGINRIVIGILDPHEKVAGKGVKKLKDSGCDVVVGVLEQECYELNKRFFTFHTKKRPYIILKWAESVDGFLAPLRKSGEAVKPVWVSNRYSRQLVHKWRSEEQAILVGTNTVLEDNPNLTTRHWKGGSPVRVVLDKNLRIPKDFSVWDGEVKTIFLVDKEMKGERLKIKSKKTKENIIFEKIDFSSGVAQQICRVLYKHNLQSVIIEGGKQTLETFINADLWDETRVFSGSTTFKKGLKVPEFSGKLINDEKIVGDVLRVYAKSNTFEDVVLNKSQ